MPATADGATPCSCRGCDRALTSSESSLEDRVKCTRLGRSPGSRIALLPASSRPSRPVTLAGFVPDYSDGVAAASHRLPWALMGIPGTRAGAYPNDRGTANRAHGVRDALRPAAW